MRLRAHALYHDRISQLAELVQCVGTVIDIAVFQYEIYIRYCYQLEVRRAVLARIRYIAAVHGIAHALYSPAFIFCTHELHLPQRAAFVQQIQCRGGCRVNAGERLLYDGDTVRHTLGRIDVLRKQEIALVTAYTDQGTSFAVIVHGELACIGELHRAGCVKPCLDAGRAGGEGSA